MATDGRHERGRRIVSVRTRIVAVITLVAALGMLTVGTVVYFVERTRILAQIDERLEANLASARFIVTENPPLDVDGVERDWASSYEALESVVRRMSPDDNTGAVGIVDGRAALVPGVPLDVDLLSARGFITHVSANVTDAPVLGTFAEQGVVWRYLAVPVVVSGSPEQAMFVLAYDVKAELAEFDDPKHVYLIACVLALIAIAGVAAVVSTRLLRPLRRMRETAERVSARSLSERLPVDGRDDVSELARTMNAMLDRIDGAVDSQRRLLSDVGHELKTPITIVRGHVEVMDPTDPTDVRETQELVIDELERMDQLVRDLAAAAKLHGAAPITPAQVDAADLLAQIVRKAEGIDGARVTAGPSADVVVLIDAARITQAMLQLAQNGVTHGGGDITIGSTASAESVSFWVRDQGPGVPEERRTEIFDRFTRDEESAGSGLGLNIVQVIARAHGGEARVVAPPQGHGATFLITVPRTGPTSESTTHPPEH